MTTPPDGHYLTQPLVAKAEMLIRRPVAEVFAAFVDPAVTTRFWFTKSSGPLTLGARVQWDWEMYGASTQVDVHAVEQDTRILIVWDADAEPNSVEWRFDPRLDGSTFVNISNSGFTGDGDVVAAQALDSTGGFALVLAGLKAWLEHGIDLKLVPDRFPDGHV